MKKVLVNQVLIDIAMQETGNVEDLFTIAMLFNKSITDTLIPGYEFSFFIENSAFQKNVVFILNKKGNNPASADDNGMVLIPSGGIGFMRISPGSSQENNWNNQFIIS